MQSATASRSRQSPRKFLPCCRCFDEGARARGWTVGNPFVIRHCRVGVLNEIGELLAPKVAVLLIGERPGLATAESLSAYMAYRPGKSHTDANRNLISNIHSRGLKPQAAADRILNFAAQMMALRISGFSHPRTIAHSAQRTGNRGIEFSEKKNISPA